MFTSRKGELDQLVHPLYPWLVIITASVSVGGGSGVVGEPWSVVRGCFCSSCDVVWSGQSEGMAFLSLERLRVGEGITTTITTGTMYMVTRWTCRLGMHTN